jgi:hypothetical protein
MDAATWGRHGTAGTSRGAADVAPAWADPGARRRRGRPAPAVSPRCFWAPWCCRSAAPGRRRPRRRPRTLGAAPGAAAAACRPRGRRPSAARQRGPPHRRPAHRPPARAASRPPAPGRAGPARRRCRRRRGGRRCRVVPSLQRDPAEAPRPRLDHRRLRPARPPTCCASRTPPSARSPGRSATAAPSRSAPPSSASAASAPPRSRGVSGKR